MINTERTEVTESEPWQSARSSPSGSWSAPPAPPPSPRSSWRGPRRSRRRRGRPRNRRGGTAAAMAPSVTSPPTALPPWSCRRSQDCCRRRLPPRWRPLLWSLSSGRKLSLIRGQLPICTDSSAAGRFFLDYTIFTLVPMLGKLFLKKCAIALKIHNPGLA